ncbi:PAS domain-containing sensor histidine kinase [Sphingomonas sp. Root241]|uniref:hybrid sensor histidine kinase/response regulator n=1 Tax=Sphingomonas sp. Root241 TaxID=1736501 RepID=UPI0006FC7C59|nr:PAS domain-containing sensor histidine kinase [Sphingomonas sp. Root241]KRC79983.1 histidine kinase [Sphingomonas sp. Root241]
MTTIADSSEAGVNRFEMLVQSVTDYAIYMLDPTGKVVSWNAGAQRFKGYREDEILGQHFSRFYTDADRAAGIPALALRTAEFDGRFEAEGWRVRKDGTHFWASVVIDPIRQPDGTLIGFAKVTRDLTDRRIADEALRRSEERFRLLVQSVTDYAIYMLDTGGHVASWNAGAERFKGYTADEIIGEHFSRFYTEEDREAGIPRRALETATNHGRFEAEGWRVRKDGTRFWANVVIDPVRDSSGTLVGFAKVTRDLTERRQSQLALEQAQEAFFHSQKMEAIGQLTGGVAHDFNNLLAAIVGSLDLARRKMANGADISRFIDNAMKAAERGAALTQRMLAFARKQELALETVDPVALVRGMAELLQRTIGGGVRIDTEFPLVVPHVHADPAQLELGLINLAVNARDAMPDGGRIVIAAREEHVASGEGLKPGAYVCLSVIDNGQGMDAETLARATEPFYTTKGVGKGTGLGLSMVHGFAEQCGGKLSLRSRVGEGTTAELWLPVSDGDVPGDRPEASEQPPAAMDQLVVLAVDDDALVLTNTAAMLEDAGHRVLLASSGRAALQLLSEARVDMVITDFAMPEMNGAQFAEAAQAGWPGLPVLLVSGYAELPEGIAEDLPRLAKPFGQDQLLRGVARTMAANRPAAELLKFPARKRR